MSFARKSGDKYGKKLMDAAKIASKRVVQKAAEAVGDLIGNKISYKITSLGKTKSKEKKNEKGKEKEQEIYIPTEKRQQIIDDLRLFWASYKNGIPKNHKLARYNAWWST